MDTFRWKQEVELYNFYKDIIGVGIVQPYVEWNGGETYLEQLNLRIAAGDMPDMFTPWNGVETELIENGALLDLTDLLPEKAPHLWESIPGDVWDAVKANDPTGQNRIYVIPQVMSYGRNGAMIRKDWLDNLGLDMPTTQEEFVEVLRAFKNDDPNGNGWQMKSLQVVVQKQDGWDSCLDSTELQCGKDILSGIFMMENLLTLQ